MHNEEASYYHHLAQTENNILKKKYFQQESRLLKKYNSQINKDCKLACLSETDRKTFENTYGFKETYFIPCFISWQTLSIKEGRGEYCLYHGNLSISENEEAVSWLIKNIFSELTVPFVIAGKGIGNGLRKEAKKYPHISLINNPSIEEINCLVEDAQINVLPSMNATGVKLKLLNALLNGRYCITNYNGVAGSKIDKGVVVPDTVAAWLLAVSDLMQKEFKGVDIERRRDILLLYNNQENAKKLNALW
jgi:hypothetical protein